MSEKEDEEAEGRSAHLTRRVRDLGNEFLATIPNRLRKGCLNGRIVRVHKVVLHKLNRQRRLA